jgi:hypothetical protein
MLKIEDLKKGYLDKVLAKTPYNFRIYTDTGDYKKATRRGNTVTEYINGVFTVSGTEIDYAGADEQLVVLTTELKFLISVGDDPEIDGDFKNVSEFRNALSDAFESVPNRFILTDNGKTYSVVAIYTLPLSGQRAIQTLTGDSFTFTCTLNFAYLKNALNASDVSISIDGEIVPCLEFAFSRRPAISADIYSNSANTESAAYAESAGFAIDLTLPAFINKAGGACANYILGLEDANTPHTVNVLFGEKSITKTMIFGESSAVGKGLDSVRYTISLVPYASVQIVEG